MYVGLLILPITREGDLTAKGCERVRLSLNEGGFHADVEDEGEPVIALAMRRAAAACCS
jgi:hypothetical protein